MSSTNKRLGDLVGICFLAALAVGSLGCEVQFSENPSPDEVMQVIERRGAGRVEEVLWNDAPGASAIRAGVSSCDPEWMKVAASLWGGGYAHVSEEMIEGFSECLPGAARSLKAGQLDFLKYALIARMDSERDIDRIGLLSETRRDLAGSRLPPDAKREGEEMLDACIARGGYFD